MEDHVDEIPSTLMSYRLGQLESNFKTFRTTLDDKFHAQSEVMDEKLKGFEHKLDEVVFQKGQIQLQDYRIKQLEVWKNRFLAALTTVATGLILVLLTQIIVLATGADSASSGSKNHSSIKIERLSGPPGGLETGRNAF